MKTIVKILIMLLLAGSLLQAEALEKNVYTNSTKVTLMSEKPLSVGSNTLKFVFYADKFKDADVKVKIFMPAMPGMPAMQEESKAKHTGSKTYESKVNFSMRGTWQVHIFITPKEGKKVRVKTSLNI